MSTITLISFFYGLFRVVRTLVYRNPSELRFATVVAMIVLVGDTYRSARAP